MTDDEKTIVLVTCITCLVNAVSAGGYKCDDSSSTSPSIEGSTESSQFGEVCCRADDKDKGFTVTHFHCVAGCCGERDRQHCCVAAPGNDVRYVIGWSIFGAFLFGGIVVMLMWLYQRTWGAVHECSDHKKLLKEVYSVDRLEELFLPNVPLVSAPGTIIHPMTTINGLFFTMDAASYVMPDLSQPLPQPPPPLSTQQGNNNNNDDYDDDNEENWDRWDGFPAGHVGASAIRGTHSAGRGRDNPYYQGEGEEGAQGEGGALPFYYEQYDKYSQPPPGYEEVTNEVTNEVANEVTNEVVTNEEANEGATNEETNEEVTSEGLTNEVVTSDH